MVHIKKKSLIEKEVLWRKKRFYKDVKDKHGFSKKVY